MNGAHRSATERFAPVGLRLLPAAFAALIVAWSTSKGIGVTIDSPGYLAEATSIADGHGFTVPTPTGYAAVTHSPPLYPALLSPFIAFGFEATVAARMVAIALAAANAVLIAGLILMHRQASIGWAATGGILFFASTDAAAAHSVAMSDSMFLALYLGGLVLVIYGIREADARHICGGAAVIGLSGLTRFVGVALVPATAMAVLLLAEPRRRLRLASLTLLIGLAPNLLWAARNLRTTGEASNRPLAWHPFGISDAKTGVASAGRWVIGTRPALGALLLLAVLGLLSWRCRRSLPHTQPLVPVALLLSALFYTVALIVTMSFFDDDTTLNPRFLMPLHAVVIITVMVLLADSSHREADPVARSRTRLAVGLVGTLVAIQGLGSARTASREGIEYGSPTWSSSRVFDALSALPAGVVVYSDLPEIVQLHARRLGAEFLPRRTDPLTNRPDPDTDAHMRLMRRRLESGEAVIALFGVNRGGYFMTADEVRPLMPLEVITSDTVGAVYQWRGITVAGS